MGAYMTSALISVEDLSKIMNAPDVKIVDASYGLPPADGYIGNAIIFDIDAVADLQAPLPHTLPSAEFFAACVGKMGISNNDRVIVYDRAGMHMAASRVWWMFRVFGHDNVFILDGGLPVWREKGLPLSSKSGALSPAAFQATFRPGLFKQQADIKGNIDRCAFVVVDARDSKRYTGEAAEPRPGMDSGHIPGSLSLPFTSLIDPSTKKMKPVAELKTLISAIGIDTRKPIACTCGSGVTACVVALALHEAGYKDAAIYGGSWAEWGGDRTLPKTKGSNP